MAQVKPFKFDVDGFPIELDTALDDMTLNSVTLTGGDLAMGSGQITGLADGVLAGDAVNKSQLDSVAAGFDPKASVRMATAAALPAYTAAGSGVGKTLTANANGALSVDGVVVALNDRILVRSESAGAHVDHGIYDVTQLGTAGAPFILTRSTDFDSTPVGEVSAGAFTFASEGTANADTGWYVTTNDPITVDTTAIAFSQFAGVGAFTGGNGIDVTAGVISVDLSATPGLEFSTALLQVLVDPAGAINRLAAGIGVNLEAASPSLQIASNELGLKIDPAGALAKGAAGVAVQVDGSTITIVGNQLVAAASPDTEFSKTALVAIAKGDPVFPSANDNVSPCDNTNNNSRKYVGVAKAAALAAAAVTIQADGILAGVTVAGTPAFGDIVWLATPSGLTVTLPTGAGTHRMVIGKMINATDMIIEPQYVSKIA